MRRFIYWRLGAALILLLFIGGSPSPEARTNSEYTVEEIQKFWEENLLSFVSEQLLQGNHENETARMVMQDRFARIHARFDKEASIDVIGRYVDPAKRVSVSSSLKPSLAFIVPALMDTYYEGGAHESPTARQIFLTHLTVLYLHELDHLAFDDSPRPKTLEERTNIEAGTWAKTAQTLELISGNPDFPLHPSDKIALEAWIQSGRDEHSASWRHFIRENYRGTLPSE